MPKLSNKNTLPHIVAPASSCQAQGLTESRATEMDVTMIGLQNAGKTSLLRVLAVGLMLYASLFATLT